MIATEQCLPAAIDRLYAAVARLIDPQKELAQDVLRIAPSLYEQLCAGITPADALGVRMLRGGGKSKPPARIDVLDLRIEIDNACQAWQPAGQSTPDRLRALVARRWRPQDTAAVEQIAAGVESWTARIGVLLSPQRVKHVSAPCPACSATHIYRKDSLGETVRVPALQITTQGCVCVACNATWAPDRYLFLCRMLGFELPKGVLE